MTPAQDEWVGIQDNNGIVTWLTVQGPDSWDDLKTFDSCAQFLPPDASEYNAVDANGNPATGAGNPITDYHSGVGDLVLDDYGGGSCLLHIVQS